MECQKKKKKRRPEVHRQDSFSADLLVIGLLLRLFLLLLLLLGATEILWRGLGIRKDEFPDTDVSHVGHGDHLARTGYP